MSNAYSVTIDVPLLRLKLSKREGRVLSLGDVKTWLNKVGFVETEGGWIVQEDTLRQIDPAHILKLRKVA